MSPPLPDRIDPWRYAEAGKVLEGVMALAELPRLAPLLVEGGEAGYRLAFGREGGRAVVSGEVRSRLALRCQRCLGCLALEVDATFALAFVTGLEEAGALPAPYEPAVVVDGRVRPLELVEDELLLAVPDIPLHEDGACSAPVAAAATEGASQDERPFAVLASLRKGGDAPEH
jgi:uncharacterized protein